MCTYVSTVRSVSEPRYCGNLGSRDILQVPAKTLIRLCRCRLIWVPVVKNWCCWLTYCRPPSGPLWKYRFSYRFFLLKIQVIYRFFNKKYRLKKVPPNSHKDLKLKKKHLMNFCTTNATIKLIWILQSPSEWSEQGKNLQFLDSFHHFFGTKK